MIYEIKSNQVPLAMQINDEFKFIVMSCDKTKSLVKINNTENIEILNSYLDENLTEVLLESCWQQDCTDC